jgi:SAM-dependent methyltransferase
MTVSNREFWDKRYKECPALGSGPGSRGFVIVKKRKLVKKALGLLSAKSVIDIGCGDLCWLDKDLTNTCFYRGLDISPIVIEANKTAWPAVEFEVCDIVNEVLAYSADLVVCFDVLIHQANYNDFVSALKNALQAAKLGALISYKKNPNEAMDFIDEKLDATQIHLENQFQEMRKKIGKISGMVATYHSDINKEILKLFPSAIIKNIDSYRSQNVYMITNLR